MSIQNDVPRTTTRRRRGLAASAVPMLERVWIAYGRISKTDPKDGGGASIKIEDQLAQCCAYIHGLDPEARVIQLRDNKSAFDPEVVRDGWLEAMRLITEGRVVGIVGWHVDRLSRQVLQVRQLWDACERTGTQVHTLRSGHITDPDWLTFESMQAERESRIKAARMLDHHHRLAVSGRPHGGRRRFGYLEPMTAGLNEDEAAVIQELVADLLAGTSLYRLAKRLNEQGVPTPGKAKAWNSSNLGAMLKGEHLAARRMYLGEDVGEADWPEVIDYATHLRVKKLLENPERRTTEDAGKLKHLLPSIATCFTCGAPMRSAGGKGRKLSYACATGRHVKRQMAMVDDTVEQLTVARLMELDEHGLLPDDAAAQKVTHLTGYIKARSDWKEQQWDLYTEEKLSLERWQKAEAKADADIRKATTELAEAEANLAAPHLCLVGMTGKGAPAAWAKADLDRKRAILRVLWESIRIKGAPHSRAPWVHTDAVLKPKLVHQTEEAA